MGLYRCVPCGDKGCVLCSPKQRSGTKTIKQFPADEPIVAMIEFQGTIFIATSKCVYKKIDDELHPLDIVEYQESCDG